MKMKRRMALGVVLMLAGTSVPAQDLRHSVDRWRSDTRVQLERRFPWHEADNWSRIRPGMSSSQVEAILGKPTGRNVAGPDSGAAVTFFYQGDAPGKGWVSGSVEFNDQDQVIGGNVEFPGFKPGR